MQLFISHAGPIRRVERIKCIALCLYCSKTLKFENQFIEGSLHKETNRCMYFPMILNSDRYLLTFKDSRDGRFCAINLDSQFCDTCRRIYRYGIQKNFLNGKQFDCHNCDWFFLSFLKYSHHYINKDKIFGYIISICNSSVSYIQLVLEIEFTLKNG